MKYQVSRTFNRTRVTIKNHADLIRTATRIRELMQEDKKLGMLFMVDPVLAMKEAGFVPTRSMARHIYSRFPEIISYDDKRAWLKQIIQCIRRRQLFRKIKRGELEIPLVVGVTLRANTNIKR